MRPSKSTMKVWNALSSNESVRFLSPYIFLNCVLLSISRRVYLFPPMAFDGPANPISQECHIWPNLSGSVDGSEFLLAFIIIAVSPGSMEGLWSSFWIVVGLLGLEEPVP